MAKVTHNWISEEEAANLMGLSTAYLRKSVTQKRKFPIAYSRVSGRKIVYSKTDIDNWIYENSTLT